MSLFSKCWDCITCMYYGGACLAGNGDDDYFPASIEQMLDRLSKCKYIGKPKTSLEKFEYKQIQWDYSKI